MKNLLPHNWQFDLTHLDGINTDKKWLAPPLVDLCARLRELGQSAHGNFKSEGAAARMGGFLHIVTPPDTSPVLENGSLFRGLRDKAMSDGGIYLHILGALTSGLKGENPANIAGIKQGGAIGVSNARAGFANDDVLLRALEYAATFGVKVFFYPDEPSLSKDGVVHDGYVASYHGLAGIPWIAETVALSKQLLIVEETGVSAHFGQLTCKSSIELVRNAKAKGLPVTCDVAMHQLHLTDDAISGFNALAYVLPPLRSNTDQKALITGLKDGTIDAICSHHEPLAMSAKLAPFAECSAGISNFDSFVALGCQLVADKILTPEQLIEKIAINPAKIAGIEQIWQEVGGAVLIDPDYQWVLTKENMQSHGKNTPFINQAMTGKVERVFFDV